MQLNLFSPVIELSADGPIPMNEQKRSYAAKATRNDRACRR